jgi:hypothetical protein
MDAKKQLQSHSFALVRVVLTVAPLRGRFVGHAHRSPDQGPASDVLALQRQGDTRLPRFKKVATKRRGQVIDPESLRG